MERRRLLYFTISVLMASALVIVALSANAKNPLTTSSAMAAMPGPSGYHLLKKIALGGEGGWGAPPFDSATRRLFISRQSKVIVLNVASEKVVCEIPSTEGAHDISL